MAKENKDTKLVDAVLSKMDGVYKGKTFNQLKSMIEGDLSGLAKNEFLNQLKNQIAKISMGNFVKTKVPFIDWFWKEGHKVGDYELIRQTLIGVRDEHDFKVRANEIDSPEVKSQIFKTVWRDRYRLTLNEDIIAGAMTSIQGLSDFISHYTSTITHAFNIAWLERFLLMFQSIPVVYKLQSDQTNGVNVAKELWRLITKMGMVSTKFNAAGVPNATVPSEMLIILNSRLTEGIQFDGVGGVYNFKDIKNGGTIKNVYTYDFLDDVTLGVILTKDSFVLNERINKNTNQAWAESLNNQEFFHHWVRGAIVDFANSVRIVVKGFADTKIDWQKSPFSHYTTPTKETLIKDERDIIDVTSFVTNETSEDLKHVERIKVRQFIGGNYVNEGDVLAMLKTKDYRIDTSLLQVVNETDNYAIIKATLPYYVDEGTDEFIVRFTKKVNP